MLIKLLSNLLCGLAVFGLLYSVLYFRVFPRLINHYRKVMRASRKYERDVAAIRKDSDSDRAA
jgi:hypothetical protein